MAPLVGRVNLPVLCLSLHQTAWVGTASPDTPEPKGVAMASGPPELVPGEAQDYVLSSGAVSFLTGVVCKWGIGHVSDLITAALWALALG